MPPKKAKKPKSRSKSAAGRYTNLDPSFIKELKEIYSLFDKDKKGILFDDLPDAMRAAYINPTPQEIEAVKQKYNQDGKTSHITFEQLLETLNQPHWKFTDNPVALREAFQVFDKEDKKYLTKDEFLNIIDTCGDIHLSGLVREEFIKEAVDNDKVVYDKFIQMITKDLDIVKLRKLVRTTNELRKRTEELKAKAEELAKEKENEKKEDEKKVTQTPEPKDVKEEKTEEKEEKKSEEQTKSEQQTS